MQTPLIAGNSLEPIDNNMTGNGECDCLKTYRIGKSAGKLLNTFVQGETSTTISEREYVQVNGNREHPEKDDDIVCSSQKCEARRNYYLIKKRWN